MLLSWALALAAVALGAAPDMRQECKAAYESGQELRQRGKLLDARMRLAACAAGSCAGFIQRDCAVWTSEISNELPSLVIAARAGGAEVAVLLDGAPLSGTVMGVPLEVDPGAHALRFEAEGYRPLDVKVVATIGQKKQRVDVELEPVAAVAPAAAVAPEPQPAPPAAVVAESRPGSPRLRVAGVVLLGAGAVVGLAGGVLGLFTFGQEQSMAASCSPVCMQNDLQRLRTQYRATDGLFVAALAVGLTGAVVAIVARVLEAAP